MNGENPGRATGGLRENSRSWLIYGDETASAVIRSLEVAALGMTGRTLAKHVRPEVRAIGHFMMRLAEGRIRLMQDAGGVEEEAIGGTARVMEALAGKREMDKQALDEIYATVFHAERRARAAGIVGPGTLRSALRGD